MKFAIGAPEISAVIRYTNDEGEIKAYRVKKGDKPSELILTGYPENITIENATVVGFTLKSIQRPTNTNTVWDGIPAYVQDPDEPEINAGSLFTMAEETTQIRSIVVNVGDDEKPVLKTILVEKIKSIVTEDEVTLGED